MKRIFTCLLVGALCLSLAACHAASKEKPDLSIHNKESDAALTFGMSKEEVEELLGSGRLEMPLFKKDAVTNEEPYATVRYGTEADEICVIYDNNLTVAGLTFRAYFTSEVDLDYVSDWRLPNEITCGSSMEEVSTHYGEQEDSGPEVLGGEFYEDPANQVTQLFWYYFDASGQVEEPQEDSSHLVFMANGQNSKIYAIALYAMDPQTLSYNAPLSQ